jgi:hypothetical protein
MKQVVISTDAIIFLKIFALGEGGHSRRIRAIWKASLPEPANYITTFKIDMN